MAIWLPVAVAASGAGNQVPWPCKFRANPQTVGGARFTQPILSKAPTAPHLNKLELATPLFAIRTPKRSLRFQSWVWTKSRRILPLSLSRILLRKDICSRVKKAASLFSSAMNQWQCRASLTISRQVGSCHFQWLLITLEATATPDRHQVFILWAQVTNMNRRLCKWAW